MIDTHGHKQETWPSSQQTRWHVQRSCHVPPPPSFMETKLGNCSRCLVVTNGKFVHLSTNLAGKGKKRRNFWPEDGSCGLVKTKISSSSPIIISSYLPQRHKRSRQSNNFNYHLDLITHSSSLSWLGNKATFLYYPVHPQQSRLNFCKHIRPCSV